jgi:3-methyladenine DNA glycosylase/8-oxoguanine DNA glycosylase
VVVVVRQVHIRIAPFALQPTLSMQNLGRFDPTVRQRADVFQKVHLDRDGRPLVWRLETTADGVRVEVHGDRSGELDAFVTQFPVMDGAETFRPAHPVLRRLARGFQGLRLLRMPWTFDVAAGAVLQQRVRWKVAYDDFRRIAERWGTKTPSGTAFPTAAQLAALQVSRLEAVGIDAKRARALIGLARAEAARPFLHYDADLDALRQRLLRIPGIGPWTTDTIAGFAYGDPDAVPIGDLHLPSLVTSSLAGEPEGTDERMLQLLEPYRGQRFRVVRLLSWAQRHTPHALRPVHSG